MFLVLIHLVLAKQISIIQLIFVLFDILDKTAKEPVSLVLPTRIIRGSSVKDLRLNRTMHTNLTE